MQKCELFIKRQNFDEKNMEVKGPAAKITVYISKYRALQDFPVCTTRKYVFFLFQFMPA